MGSAPTAIARRVVADARTRTLSFAALFFAIVWANAWGYQSTYPTAADRLKFIATFADNKAARILYGAGHALTTTGGYTAWRAGGTLSIFAALFGIFAAARAMRGDEDAGRTEVLLVGSVTRETMFGSITAGIAITVAALFVAVALGAVAGGLTLQGSAYFGLVLASVVAVYAAIGAVANQVFPTRRGALGVSGAILGLDFLLRVIADTTDHFFVHWFTPMGWAEEMRAFSGSRAIVLVLPLCLVAALLSAAAALNAKRDVGAGYVEPRDTAPPRATLLGSPFRLALRLDRITIASWVAAIAVFAFVIGTVAKTVEKLDLPESFREQIKKLGGIDVTRAKGYVGLTFVIFVFAIALFVCGQLATARDEESTHRLETLLALPYGRRRWMGGRIALTLLGVSLAALTAGLGTGIGVLVTGGHMTMLDGLAGGLNVVPAQVLFIGVGVCLLAFAPRSGIGLLYAFVGVAFVWELFGALLSFPNWVLDLSPFHHVAPVPAKPMELLSAAAMVAIGAGAAVLGTWRFRARDLAGD